MNKPSEAEMAQMAMQFLNRVQMTGQEADAFMAVRGWLMSKANGAPAPIPPVEEQASMDAVQ